MILDGFGLNPSCEGNSIYMAHKPNMDFIMQNYPNTTLIASGKRVGLPEGQMGNSEVGHLNIGAGRVVYQELTRISKAIDDGDFFQNEAFLNSIEHAKRNNSALHLIGLLSDGGVHSHIEHLFALLLMTKQHGLSDVYVHCLLDGRDVSPTSGIKYIEQLQSFIDKNQIAEIATISGRYYAMDRDKRYDRVEKAYNILTLNEKGSSVQLRENNSTNKNNGEFAIDIIEKFYEQKIYDEFIPPTAIIENERSRVNDGDALINFNFRPDRAREITRAFVDDNFEGFSRKKTLRNLSYTSMTNYDKTIESVNVAYNPIQLNNTLGQYVSDSGLSQLRIAETEKYAHVTFFFNGGVEVPHPNEERILIPSPKVATYDLKPEMSAYEVTDAVINEIKKEKYDLIILNYANADMVGHTGDLNAAIKAIETLDECIKRVVDAMLKIDADVLLTADHGNADEMLDKEGNIMTAHSIYPVPLIHISNSPRTLKDGGSLCDLAPTLLSILDIKQPDEMTGESLFSE